MQIYNKLNITKNEFKQLLIIKYYSEKQTGPEIGRSLNCHSSVIYDWFKKFNIPIRNSPKLEILTNQKFGKLTVLDSYKIIKDKNTTSITLWLCKCECGTKKYIYASNLKHNIIGCGICSKLENGESAFRALYSSYIHRAKRKNITFNLSREQFKYLVDQNCYYCNAIPQQIYKPKDGSTDRGVYIYNGIDRIDNNKNIGYTIENCHTCCGSCNSKKSNLSKDEFLSDIERIYNYRIKKDE